MSKSNKETTGKTLTVAFLLCVVCSILVSASVILLKPMQEKNKALNLKENILSAAGLLKQGSSPSEIEESFSKIKAKLVDLDTGEYVDPHDIGKKTVLDYDQRRASKDPKFSMAVPSNLDIASIKRRARYSIVYLVEENHKPKTIIIPVHGYGLWSTLYGYLALEGDANTVVGLGFYEQAETPGLGGEVDNPRWKAFWPGKQIYNLDKSDEPIIKLVKGHVDASKPSGKYQVDGLSGASLTSRGVTNLIQYWTGDQGFKKYLKRLRKEAKGE